MRLLAGPCRWSRAIPLADGWAAKVCVRATAAECQELVKKLAVIGKMHELTEEERKQDGEVGSGGVV